MSEYLAELLLGSTGAMSRFTASALQPQAPYVVANIGDYQAGRHNAEQLALPQPQTGNPWRLWTDHPPPQDKFLSLWRAEWGCTCLGRHGEHRQPDANVADLWWRLA